MVHGWFLSLAPRARKCLRDGKRSPVIERSQPLHPVWASELWITLAVPHRFIAGVAEMLVRHWRVGLEQKAPPQRGLRLDRVARLDAGARSHIPGERKPGVALRQLHEIFAREPRPLLARPGLGHRRDDHGEARR